MPRLAHRFRLIAPDLPSLGFTEIPADRDYRYDFTSLSQTVAAFVDVMGLQRFSLYVFDYGAPVGWNLALAHPDRVVAIVSQNGNAYEEGLGEKVWAPLRAYWTDGGNAPSAAIRSRMTLDGIKATYVQDVLNPSVIEPETYTRDAAFRTWREVNAVADIT